MSLMAQLMADGQWFTQEQSVTWSLNLHERPCLRISLDSLILFRLQGCLDKEVTRRCWRLHLLKTRTGRQQRPPRRRANLRCGLWCIWFVFCPGRPVVLFPLPILLHRRLRSRDWTDLLPGQGSEAHPGLVTNQSTSTVTLPGNWASLGRARSALQQEVFQQSPRDLISFF